MERALTVRARLLALLLVMAAGAGACGRDTAEVPAGVLVVSQEQTSSFIRNFNPLTTATGPRWPTYAGVFEPLFVFNSVRSEFVPWLATAYAWENANRRLRVVTRRGVRWSDGERFSAADVAYTFNLLREYPIMDKRGVWAYLADVRATDDTTVVFDFERVFVPGMGDIVAQQIVPRHVWSQVEDPVAFPNENPVATGPFTEVRIFRNQIYELGRNPHYWQEGKPAVEAIRCPAYPSNDRANLALVFDEVDWAGNFIPAIDRVFVGRDPERHAYWFPLTGSTVFLYANTHRAPFDDVRVRKALSMGIDRELVNEIALYRYSRPADATALSDAYRAWRDSAVVEAGDWVRYDPGRANSILDELGYTRGEDGIRRMPDGSPWSYQVLSVSGWSDWVRAAQVIARGYRELGIDAAVRTYDFGAWYPKVQRGEFDLSLGWSYEGATPYAFYRWLMASATVKPVGEVSQSNWHRYGSVTADAVLAAFETESDPGRRQVLAADMQRIFSEEAPAIPLYPNPSWAEYNVGRFTGFPSAEDPYADPSPNKFDRGDILLVLTNLRPRSAP